MILSELLLDNFRNFANAKINFGEGINIITGMNGQGKTSILESIYYLSLTKSFKAINDYTVIKEAKNSCNINGEFIADSVEKETIRLYLSRIDGKHLFLNGKEILKFSEIIGKVPCVILTLDDIKLIYGGPSERRKFLDILLSQTSPVYLNDLKNYRQVIRQRNSLLLYDDLSLIKKQIDGWNKQIIDFGSRIIKKRIEFVDFLNKNLSAYYSSIAHKEEGISVEYRSSLLLHSISKSLEDIQKIFKIKLTELFHYELERKMTLAGPHRDDLIFLHNSRLFKEYCSQGENKTLIIALKLLEWDYIAKYNTIKPLLLLDDIFGELDRLRMEGLLKFITNIGQAFITTTLDEKFSFFKKVKKIKLENYNIYYA
jgi:DNA replication and repair protein RecF